MLWVVAWVQAVQPEERVLPGSNGTLSVPFTSYASSVPAKAKPQIAALEASLNPVGGGVRHGGEIDIRSTH